MSIYKNIILNKNKNIPYYIQPISQNELTYSRCDICSEMIVKGERNTCTICYDFDLCDKCYRENSHEHLMIKK